MKRIKKFHEQKSEKDIALHCVNLIPIKDGKIYLSFSLLNDYIDKFIYNYIDAKYPFNLEDRVKCHNKIYDEFNEELYYRYEIKAIPVSYSIKEPNKVYNTFIYINPTKEDKYNKEKEELYYNFKILLDPKFNSINDLKENFEIFKGALNNLNKKYNIVK